MQTRTLLTALIPLLGSSFISALPTPQEDCSSTSGSTDLSAFTVMALRSASPIHFLSLNARGSRFYLGGNTTSYCPDVVTEQGGVCPSGRYTVLGGPDGSYLDVAVPGGQQTYVSPDGSVGFTSAHSAAIPQGAVTDPFSYTSAQEGSAFNGTLSTTVFGATGFMACPAKDNTEWQVYAALPNAIVPSGNVNDCLGFSAVALEFTNEQYGAWQYV